MQAVNPILMSEKRGENGFSLAGVARGAGAALRRVLGCWHLELGRPQSQGSETYRACLSCGARRSFDPQSWKLKGRFYYHSPAPAELYALRAVDARRAQPRPARLKLAA